MKTKLPLIAALYCGLCTASSAFTLDFVGLIGTHVPPTLVIEIPGYGSVEFAAANDSELVVNEAYENDNGFGAPSLSFDENEAAVVTFVGLEALHVDFDFVGVSSNEDFDVQPHPENANAYIVSLTGGEDGAGIYQVSWEADCIPEPSTSLLGALGATLLVLRRRR